MHVESASITDFKYDEEHAKLFVRFNSGEEYMYVGVPPTVHRSFADADSRGAYFHDEIRDCYPYNKLDA